MSKKTKPFQLPEEAYLTLNLLGENCHFGLRLRDSKLTGWADGQDDLSLEFSLDVETAVLTGRVLGKWGTELASGTLKASHEHKLAPYGDPVALAVEDLAKKMGEALDAELTRSWAIQSLIFSLHPLQIKATTR